MENIDHEEIKLSKLKREMELLDKQMNLTDSEQRMDSMSNKSEMKKISLEMKQLRLQTDELRMQLKKKELDNMNLIREVMNQECPVVEESKLVSAKIFIMHQYWVWSHTSNSPTSGKLEEVTQFVESRLLDLSNKYQSLLHCVQIKDRIFCECKQTLKEIIEHCREDSYPTETDCIQQIRELEIQHAKALKNISESENAKIKFKTMLQHLQKRGNSYHRLIQNLIEEKKMIDNEEENTVKEAETEEQDEAIGNNDLKNQQREYKELKNAISIIKDETACYDIHDIDSRFLEQKAMHEGLLELIKKAEKRLQDLKEEKRDLATKRNLIKEVDALYPKSDIELTLSKNRLAEQEIRLELAKGERDRINSVSNRAMELFQRLIPKMNHEAKKEGLRNKTLEELSDQFKNIIMRVLLPTTDRKRMSRKK